MFLPPCSSLSIILDQHTQEPDIAFRDLFSRGEVTVLGGGDIDKEKAGIRMDRQGLLSQGSAESWLEQDRTLFSCWGIVSFIPALPSLHLQNVCPVVSVGGNLPPVPATPLPASGAGLSDSMRQVPFGNEGAIVQSIPRGTYAAP